MNFEYKKCSILTYENIGYSSDTVMGYSDDKIVGYSSNGHTHYSADTAPTHPLDEYSISEQEESDNEKL